MKKNLFLFLSLMTLSFAQNKAEFLEFAGPLQENEQRLYSELYDLFLQGLKAEEEPFLLAIGGSPASGKTRWRRGICSSMTNVHLHDMDEVLIRLPGYQNDLALFDPKTAFENWWPTAREIAEKLVRYAIASKLSILYDRSCGAEGSYQDLLQAKNSGYKVTLIGLCVDPEVALERTRLREKEEGRTVTQAIIEEYRARFSALWPHYLTFVDEANLYDTSTPTPRLIFSTRRGIQDPARYQTFLQEKGAFIPTWLSPN